MDTLPDLTFVIGGFNYTLTPQEYILKVLIIQFNLKDYYFWSISLCSWNLGNGFAT